MGRYVSEPGSIRMDATCYGSDMRYPTDIKLLWEAVGWNHRPLKGHCKVLGPPAPYQVHQTNQILTVHRTNGR